VSPINLSQLKELAGEKPVAASVHVQVQARATKLTKNGKPYCEITFADATGNCPLKIWSDSPHFDQFNQIQSGSIVCLTAEWTQNSYGLNAKDIVLSEPDAAAMALFLAGDPATRDKQERDFADILAFVASIADPRLRGLCEIFLEQFGDRFRRTAAARKNHHARRGGLVEHVAQMMRSAAAIQAVYPDLNRDLLLAGVLFHDCGKLWENTYPEHGFCQTHSIYGEMLGHIPLGIEIVNKLWSDLLDSPEAEEWKLLKPGTETTRLHLAHLIGSHHGQLEFGSPVLPRVPEAFALHYIDNLDAKLEMVRDAYAQANEVATGIYERVFPLPTGLVRPLQAYLPPLDSDAEPAPAEAPADE
jgi:3'-5' exoribonuclease